MSEKLEKTLAEIDRLNSEDPNQELIAGERLPKSLVYGQRMSACLIQYWPNASEYLQIAVRAQHVKRWAIARSEYPEGKVGYLKWRKALGQFHAETARSVMLTLGYSEEEAEYTATVTRKEKLKTNHDSQTLEDVACLVFLMFYFAPFAAKHSEEKIIRIVQKTWKKMSAQGQEIALSLSLPDELAHLVNKALTS